LGGAVAEVVAEACPVPVVRVGIADRFTETGPYMDLLNRYGLAVKDVVQAAHKALVLKKRI
jgi:transketolase